MLLASSQLHAESQAGTPVSARLKAGYEERGPSLGSPNTPSRLLIEEDLRTGPLFRYPEIDGSMEEWYAFKAGVKDDIGLRFGMDYTAWYQSLSDSLTDVDWAASGIARFFGEWTPVGGDAGEAGRLVFKVDNRHKLGSDIPVSALGGEAGYIGQTAVLFNDIGWELIDFNWQQPIGDGGGLIIGRYDPMDYISVLGYANPWTGFASLATLLNPAVAFPDASWGVGGGSWVGENWYVKGAINDANGSLQNYKLFRDGGEFFTWAEVGWSPSRAERYTTNVHLAAWHVDERKEVGLGSANGFNLGANWSTRDGRWMGFVRAGWASGDAAFYEESYTLGFTRKFRRNADAMGLAINWGQPPQADLDPQVTGEFFYRLQLSENVAVTPNLQLLRDPALNPTDDEVWVTGLRLRLTL